MRTYMKTNFILLNVFCPNQNKISFCGLLNSTRVNFCNQCSSDYKII